MSTLNETTENQIPEIPETKPDPTQSLRDQIVADNLETPRRSLGIRQAQAAGLVADALAMTALDRKRQAELWEITKRYLPGGQLTPAEASAAKLTNAASDDMQVNVGDQTTHIHIAAPAQEQTAQQQSTTPPQTQTQTDTAPNETLLAGIAQIVKQQPQKVVQAGSKWLIPALIASGVGGGTLGGGLAAWLATRNIANTINNMPPPVVQKVEPWRANIGSGIETVPLQ